MESANCHSGGLFEPLANKLPVTDLTALDKGPRRWRPSNESRSPLTTASRITRGLLMISMCVGK